ncbi:hypothetical protein AB5J52_49615 (plasmid) [Streptomyces sp. R39]|uniref:ATP-binding protein n=1 Tax=Streptomyces sp. R39 TaxID=3238631 RepID=A0AB39R2Q2_9ACTN
MIRAASTPPAPRQETIGTAPDRARVVLYTSSQDYRVATQTLAGLQDFAARRGWLVVHKVYDLAPAHTPLRDRTGWLAVRYLLAAGGATGFVVPDEREIAWHSGDLDALRSWLLSLPAFAACAYPRAGRGPCGHTPPSARAPGDDVGLTLFPVPAGRFWERVYALHPLSVRQVREAAWTYLVLSGWPGDIVAAIEVLARLAYNAVVHARPVDGAAARMVVRLTLSEHDALLVDVEDPRPDFPHSAAAIAGVLGSGLLEARRLGAKVSWVLSADGTGKSVRALLLAEPTHG